MYYVPCILVACQDLETCLWALISTDLNFIWEVKEKMTYTYHTVVLSRFERSVHMCACKCEHTRELYTQQVKRNTGSSKYSKSILIRKNAA
jgi:hypothetical protein